MNYKTMLKSCCTEFLEQYIKLRDKYCDIYMNAIRKYTNIDEIRRDVQLVCWTESDLRTQIVHNLLKKFEQLGINDVTIHTEWQLTKDKFEGEFNKIWNQAVEDACKRKGTKRVGGDIDILIGYEDPKAFELCVELKYYHYPIESFAWKSRIKNIQQSLDDGMEMLVALKSSGVAKDICFVIGDAYYHRKDKNGHRKIREFYDKYGGDVIYLEM